FNHPIVDKHLAVEVDETEGSTSTSDSATSTITTITPSTASTPASASVTTIVPSRRKKKKLPIELLSWRPTIEPEPRDGGEWMLISSSQLVFKPAGPWEKSTEYRVTVPKGVTSILGESLAEDFHFTFTTPTIRLRSFHGYYPRATIVH